MCVQKLTARDGTDLCVLGTVVRFLADERDEVRQRVVPVFGVLHLVLVLVLMLVGTVLVKKRTRASGL